MLGPWPGSAEYSPVSPYVGEGVGSMSSKFVGSVGAVDTGRVLLVGAPVGPFVPTLNENPVGLTDGSGVGCHVGASDGASGIGILISTGGFVGMMGIFMSTGGFVGRRRLTENGGSVGAARASSVCPSFTRKSHLYATFR